MADYIVGLDFGSRAIKLVTIDNTDDPVVVDYDREPLTLDRDPYLERTQSDDSEATSEDQPDDESAEAPDSGALEEPGESAGGPDEQTADPDEETGEWEADFGPSQSWIETLDTLLARHEFEQGTRIVTFLPEERAISIHQEVPFAERSKVESILPNLLEDRLPLDPDEIVYDFELITSDDGGGDEEHTAVVGIGRNDDIRTFLDRLADSQLNPAVLGIPELLMRYLAEATIPFGETSAVVDIGHQFTRVVVLHDGEPVIARSLQAGGWTVTKRIAQRFDISLEQAERYKKNRATVAPPEQARDREEEALSQTVRGALQPLVRDLRRNFQSLYANRRIELDNVYLSGGSSRIDALETYLHDQLSIPVESLPLETAAGYQIIEGEGDPETALAVAAALQPVRDRSKKRLHDLRKGEFAYSGHSSYVRSQITRWGAVAALLVALFFGTLFAKKYRLEAQAQAMDRAVAQQTRQLFGQEVTDPEIVNNIVKGEGSSQRAFVPEMSAYQLFYELTERISQDIDLQLERIDVDIDRNIVQMSGTTTDPQTVDRLATDIEQLDCIEDVSKKPVRVQSENEARFQLEISSGCS